jgi:type I restriction enzyme, S subunit
MSSEDTQLTLADICTDVSYGYTESATFEAVGPKFLRITDIQGGGFDWQKVPFCPASPQDTKKYSLEVGDIVVARTGNSTGENAQIFSPPPPAVFASYLIRFRPDGKRVNPFYVGYQLRTERFRQHVLSVRSGSAQPGANAKQLGAFPVLMVDRPQQDETVNTLRAIDDRITLLRETNTTLEAIAQALFKSWFVDFDPVHAKMQGRPPEGMDEATAALFPDSFEESELGAVPKGWSVGSVGDFARLKKGTVNPGSQPDTVFEHFSLPAFDDGQSPVIESGASIKSNKTPVPEDAVLLSKLNPHIPRIWLPVSVGRNAVCSTEFLAFQPTGVGSRELIYCLFSSSDFISRSQQLVTGTSNSHQRIKPDQVALMTSVVPTASIASAFEILMRPVFERVYANRQKVQTLSAIRDILLPRLISGQLRVNEASESLQ